MSLLEHYEFVESSGVAGFQMRDFAPLWFIEETKLRIEAFEVDAWLALFPSVAIRRGNTFISALGVYFFSGLSLTGPGARVLTLKLDNTYRHYPQRRFFHSHISTLLPSEHIRWDGTQFVIESEQINMYSPEICGVPAAEIIAGGLPYKWTKPVDEYDMMVIQRYCGRFFGYEGHELQYATFFLDRDICHMQYEITGPTPSDVRFGLGKGTGTEIEILHARRRIILSEGKGSQMVPELAHALLIKIKSMLYTSQQFKDMGMYFHSMVWFSLTTFSEHSEQVAKVLEHIPQHCTVVAPGDGWGVVKQQRPDAISGDIAWEGRGTMKESFCDTLQRAKNAPEPKVLVLSYLVNMLSEVEMAELREWTGGLVIIDVANHFPIKQLGPRVWANCLEARFMAAPVQGSYTLAYTENLLHHAHDQFPESNYRSYLQLMTPKLQQGDMSYVQLSDFLRSEQDEAYFAPAGRILNKNDISEVQPGNYSLFARTLYYLPDDFPLVPPCIGRYRGRRVGLFPFPQSGVLKHARTATSYMDVSVEVVPLPVPKRQVKRIPAILREADCIKFSFPVGHTNHTFRTLEDARAAGIPETMIATLSSMENQTVYTRPKRGRRKKKNT